VLGVLEELFGPHDIANELNTRRGKLGTSAHHVVDGERYDDTGRDSRRRKEALVLLPIAENLQKVTLAASEHEARPARVRERLLEPEDVANACDRGIEMRRSNTDEADPSYLHDW
jgi:hypothetical protein